jgi:hypothetical protein
MRNFRNLTLAVTALEDDTSSRANNVQTRHGLFLRRYSAYSRIPSKPQGSVSDAVDEQTQRNFFL